MEGVQAALLAHDYVTAAGHVHRYMLFDKSLLASEAAADTGSRPPCGTLAGTHAPPAPGVDPLAVLSKAQVELSAVVSSKFDQAVEADDQTAIDRYSPRPTPVFMEEPGFLTKRAVQLLQTLPARGHGGNRPGKVWPLRGRQGLRPCRLSSWPRKFHPLLAQITGQANRDLLHKSPASGPGAVLRVRPACCLFFYRR